jgi:UDP-2,3-diacylglucosamine pyrophosphatase LpxH
MYRKSAFVNIERGKVAFVSDCHFLLDELEDLRMLRDLKKIIDNPEFTAVFLIGDIFECWKYGSFKWNATHTFENYQIAVKKYPELLAMICNPKVYFLHGNHDYCLTENEVEFDVYTRIILNKRILITHGNDADNYNNEFLAKGRSRWLVIFDWLTDRFYKMLGVNKIKTDAILSDVVFAASDRDEIYYEWADKQPYTAIVMGHTHRPRNVRLKNVLFINTGSGYDEMEYVVYDVEKDAFTLIQKIEN